MFKAVDRVAEGCEQNSAVYGALWDGAVESRAYCPEVGPAAPWPFYEFRFCQCDERPAPFPLDSESCGHYGGDSAGPLEAEKWRKNTA